MARLAALVLLLAAAAGHARAQPPLPISEGNFNLHDVRFNDGETIDLLRLHYTTLGEARRDASGRIVNAAVLLHGTSGTGKNFLIPGIAGNLFGPGQPLDAARYYIVLPDGIGAGGSTKPSDGLHAHFPHYGYIDQVELQYRLLTEGLGIAHLRLVLGTSMGCMLIWLWGERHPDAMDMLVALGCMPIAISGRNMLWRETLIRAIRDDPDWHGGDYDAAKPPTRWLETAMPLNAIMAGNAERLQQAAPTRADAVALFDRLAVGGPERDANDMLYAFASSYDYDPAPDVEKITASLLAINFADDLINPPELGVMEPAMRRLRDGRYVLIPPGKTYGHQTLAHAEVWAPYLAEFLAQHNAAP
ncbi:MAG: alpha/beta fold hydrolase [Alphaproteobacteria bacterium]|nr:alpha/beta fold hydrolase [Alphaproteobacteria bacterium]